MESGLKCKICGAFLTSVLAANLVASNILICEPCRRKNENNPDFHEPIHIITPSENVVINISGTASVISIDLQTKYL